MGTHIRFLKDDSELGQAVGAETIMNEDLAARKIAEGWVETVKQPEPVAETSGEPHYGPVPKVAKLTKVAEEV